MAVMVGCDRTPDAIEVCAGGGLVAYEIELSSKGRTRRESILASYASSDYERVEWIVPGGQLARLIAKDIREMRLDDFMRVTHGNRLSPPTSMKTGTPTSRRR